MAYDQVGFVPDAPAEVIDDVSAIIMKARELLSDPAKWCKNAPNIGDRFCTLGALYKVAGSKRGDCALHSPYLMACGRVAQALGQDSAEPKWSSEAAVYNFNDAPTTTHADILNLLDRAASPKREG